MQKNNHSKINMTTIYIMMTHYDDDHYARSHDASQKVTFIKTRTINQDIKNNNKRTGSPESW